MVSSAERMPYMSPYQSCEKQCFGAKNFSIPSLAPSVQCGQPLTMFPTITGHIRGCRTTHQGPSLAEASSSQGGTQRNGDHCFLRGRNDPGGCWWPPTYPTWTPTTVSFSFSVSLIVAQFTIFSNFSGSELLEPF